MVEILKLNIFYVLKRFYSPKFGQGRLSCDNIWLGNIWLSRAKEPLEFSLAIATFDKLCRFGYFWGVLYHPSTVKTRREQVDTTSILNSKLVDELFVKISFVYRQKMYLFIVWRPIGSILGKAFYHKNSWVISQIIVFHYVVFFTIIRTTNQMVFF